MKRRFRARSCNYEDRCISYSTFERAKKRLEMWARQHNREILKYTIRYPSNPDSEVKCWHDFVGYSKSGIGYAYTIVEFNEEEIVITPVEMFGE